MFTFIYMYIVGFIDVYIFIFVKFRDESGVEYYIFSIIPLNIFSYVQIRHFSSNHLKI
jgi:hypothetical protein